MGSPLLRHKGGLFTLENVGRVSGRVASGPRDTPLPRMQAVLVLARLGGRGTPLQSVYSMLSGAWALSSLPLCKSKSLLLQGLIYF